jgi:hypothetical protein
LKRRDEKQEKKKEGGIEILFQGILGTSHWIIGLSFLCPRPAHQVPSHQLLRSSTMVWIGADIIELDDPACLIIIKSDRF